MAATIREKIIAGISTNLATITVANGYNTDIGANVQRSAKFGNTDNLDGVIITPGDDTPGIPVHRRDALVMEVILQAGAKFDLLLTRKLWTEDASKKQEELIGDLRKVMGVAIAGVTVKGVQYTGGGPREMPELREGEMFAVVQLTFDIRYQTKIHDPYNQ